MAVCSVPTPKMLSRSQMYGKSVSILPKIQVPTCFCSLNFARSRTRPRPYESIKSFLKDLSIPQTLTWALWLSLTALVVGKIVGLRKVDRYSQEPPEVVPFIPYIGHLLDFLWYKSNYYAKLRYGPAS